MAKKEAEILDMNDDSEIGVDLGFDDNTTNINEVVEKTELEEPEQSIVEEAPEVKPVAKVAEVKPVAKAPVSVKKEIVVSKSRDYEVELLDTIKFARNGKVQTWRIGEIKIVDREFKDVLVNRKVARVI